ncbi:MAG: DUF4492 domain-containing protein [Bacteroidaceae bacterium]|jgi:hypothetical protein|nr:DUF4492 domain-containing protein [Bacteroidaceae bacterium]MBQ6049155.1 DUF4492 domain-containing protein [Bacteroidaceae bacterium]MBR3548072.1 DUF4492 domain-containing protein [Bacteroidaceae bacterium]
MNILNAIFRFYVEGFRRMTLGRTLWVLVLLKLFVIFVILRLFFFRPAMQGMTIEEKQQHVAQRLGIPLDK